MKRAYISVFGDCLFTLAAAFLTAFVLLGYYLPTNYCFIYSSLFALPVAAAAFKFSLYRKKRSLSEKLSGKDEREKLFQLKLLNTERVFALFKKALSVNLGVPPQNIKREKGGLFIKGENKAYFFDFSFDKLSPSFIKKTAYKLGKDFSAEIFFDECEDTARRVVAAYGDKITLNGGKKTYEFLKNAGCLPETEVKIKKPNAVKNFFIRFLDAKRAKKLFFYGVILTLFSFFGFYKIYYIAAGLFFMNSAVISALFFKKASPEKG